MHFSEIYLTKVVYSVYLAYTDKYTEKSKYAWLILTSIQKSLGILGLY